MSAPMESPLVAQAVLHNVDALSFLRDMAGFMHWVDDIVDKDKPVADDDTHAALWTALVALPRNAFYREHFNELNPLVAMAIANWRIANRLERSDRHSVDDLHIAFIVRSSYIDLVTMCATILGGLEHAVAHGPGLRRWAHGETFDGYLKNLADEEAARNAKRAA